ncbi:MAG TPA: twin-arginine translocase TatA/TatE family subunit [Flavobacteriaceae bacterium]|nr:twin-arginine translocase TatA/TatE family subunit [Flavobacteriaceae bacterium]
MIQANYILFISAPEILIVVFIVLIFFGADKVPEIVRGLAKAIKEVKHATNDIKSEITKTVEEDVDLDFTKDISKEIKEVKDQVDEITGPIKRNR